MAGLLLRVDHYSIESYQKQIPVLTLLYACICTSRLPCLSCLPQGKSGIGSVILSSLMCFMHSNEPNSRVM